MTTDSAIIIMQALVNHFSMDAAQREAWRVLQEAAQTTNKAVLEYFRTLSKEGRYNLISDIEDEWCLWCGEKQQCYCMRDD